VATDALSDVLRTVRLSGALFFLMDVTAPWEAEVPDGATLASSVLPGAQHCSPSVSRTSSGFRRCST